MFTVGRVILMALAGLLLTAPLCVAGWLDMGAAGASGWFVDGAPVAADTYPVLVLPLDGPWTDFELKASTNNFTNLCYYVMSSGTNAYTTDTNVWVYFTDDYAVDVRQWQRSAAATAIGAQLVATNSEVEFAVVLPSHACAGDWPRWMSRANDRLVWSFVRYDSIGMEMNATGTKSHWNPVVPVEWRKARTAP